MAQPRIAPGFDLTDPDLYADRVPQEELAELRRAAPIWWNPQPSDMGFNDAGFWAVTRHKDRKSTRLNSSHLRRSRMPSSA